MAYNYWQLRVNEIQLIKCLEWFLAQSKCYISICYCYYPGLLVDIINVHSQFLNDRSLHEMSLL